MKRKLLKILKREDGYVSGQIIADKLKVTRATISEYIALLKADGYNIDAKKGTGYKLVDNINFIDYAQVESEFARRAIGWKIVHLKSVDSTNDEAYRLAENGEPSGIIVISNLQTKGKGRMGRKWVSNSITNLYLSAILRPKMPPSFAPKITLIAALAVADAIKKSTALLPKIKWPNDILINGKKVCGILTEMKSESDAIDFAILGIGVNVNTDAKTFPTELKPIATSLMTSAGDKVSRQLLLERIISNLNKWHALLKDGDIKTIKERWGEYDYLLGKDISVDVANETVRGIADGIDDDGFLMLKTDDGMRKIFSGTIGAI